MEPRGCIPVGVDCTRTDVEQSPITSPDSHLLETGVDLEGGPQAG